MTDNRPYVVRYAGMEIGNKKTSLQRNGRKTVEKFRSQNERSDTSTGSVQRRPHTSTSSVRRVLLFEGASREAGQNVSSATEFRTCSSRSVRRGGLSKFFDSLDFFFVTFFCIKTKESKVHHTSPSRKLFPASARRFFFTRKHQSNSWGLL
jgi:hypothetical protein